MQPDTADESAASAEPSDLALAIVNGVCPRCGKVTLLGVEYLCDVNALADIFLVASNSCDLCLEIKKLHLVALVTADGRYKEVPETILLKHCP